MAALPSSPAGASGADTGSGIAEEEVPEQFFCPITLQVMQDPVITACGHHFERAAILEHLLRRNDCPLDRSPLTADQLVDSRALRELIQQHPHFRERRKDGLQVKVMHATGLSRSATDWNYYALLRIGNATRRTAKIATAVWNEAFVFPVSSFQEDKLFTEVYTEGDCALKATTTLSLFQTGPERQFAVDLFRKDPQTGGFSRHGAKIVLSVRRVAPWTPAVHPSVSTLQVSASLPSSPAIPVNLAGGPHSPAAFDECNESASSVAEEDLAGDVSERLASQQAELQRLQNRELQLARHLEERSSECEQLRRRVERLLGDQQAWGKARTLLESEAADARRAAAEAQRQYQALKEATELLESRAATMVTEDELRQRILELEEELRTTRESLAQAQAQMGETEYSRAALLREKQILSAELETLRQQSHQVREQNSLLIAELTALAKADRVTKAQWSEPIISGPPSARIGRSATEGLVKPGDQTIPPRLGIVPRERERSARSEKRSSGRPQEQPDRLALNVSVGGANQSTQNPRPPDQMRIERRSSRNRHASQMNHMPALPMHYLPPVS
eukprot:TRINITY_DN2999_c0_g1_i1.p1 TRINITY_DN2999_c0_g1~~TRINITY_DN2999_c0_g1_i1.p1  ORF type:complete len:573 (-),score=80.81 TRINITY_DN2999_c0_g1_i1:36-1730(-)